jgi:hypothetical protein
MGTRIATIPHIRQCERSGSVSWQIASSRIRVQVSILKERDGMDTSEAQRQFNELLDEFQDWRKEQDRLSERITAAFAKVARGEGGNPTQGILLLKESIDRRVEQIRAKMDAIIESIG